MKYIIYTTDIKYLQIHPLYALRFLQRFPITHALYNFQTTFIYIFHYFYHSFHSFLCSSHSELQYETEMFVLKNIYPFNNPGKKRATLATLSLP